MITVEMDWVSGVSGVSGQLLERGEELGTLSRLLDAARDGRGGLVLLEGPAGIGKSSVLHACGKEAEDRGVVVLQAQGDELVVQSSFAAVRELFWREAGVRTTAFDGAARLARPVFQAEADSSADRDRTAAVLHGLYWLTADLADRGPLALLIDDAQWLDVASARFLVYLARRIGTLAVLVVVGLRRGETADGGDLGDALTQLAARVLRLAPLSEEAAGQLVRGVLGPRMDDELCRSCHAATRGNPFYLRELATALKAEGDRPSLELAARVRALGAGAIAANVLVRLARLGEDCEQLANALVVLGPDSRLRHAAALAALDRRRAESAADALHTAELLSTGPAWSFVHPIVSEAIASQLPPALRASLHGEAARVLAADGAPEDRVAAHLLSAEAFGEAWVVDALRSAARSALDRGAPEAAVDYLRRALAEPPSPEARLDVLVELGRAEALLPVAQDFTALRKALALATEPRRGAEIALELALALFGVLRNVEAMAVLEEALERRAGLDADMIERLELMLIGGGIGDLVHTPRLLARAEPHFVRARRGEVRDPRALAVLAETAAMAAMPADQAAALAQQALKDERLLRRWLDSGYVPAALALCWTDRLELAVGALEAGIAEAQRRGSAPMLLQLAVIRAEAALRAGDLDGAEDYAQRALELGREVGAERVGVLWLPVVLLERGHPSAAGTLVNGLDLSGSHDTFDVNLLAHRGRVRIALGSHELGLADLLDADRRTAEARVPLSVVTDWIPAAAVALTSMGRAEEARRLTARELDQAIAFGAPRRHGVALSTHGSLCSGETGLASLREAVDRLERCGARLEHARALVNLGIALREHGRRLEARQPLAEGLDTAYACGAWAVAEHARAELVATGARPRRASLHGLDALTPAELRVVRMAATELTNREIAQTLFVSTKTVEAQLSHAYAKLGIRSRDDLPSALSDGQRLTP